MLASLLYAALFAAFSMAEDPYPPDAERYNVKLIAHVSPGQEDLSPSIEGRVVEFYHVAAGQAIAVLNTPSPSHGVIFYQNGTGYDDRTFGATTQFDACSPKNPCTYGMQVLESGVVTLNPGPGTEGVQQFHFPATAGQWTYKGDGSWYACYSDLPFGGDFAQLYWRNTDEALPEGCADVKLFPKCEVRPKLAHKHKTDFQTGCWKNVEESLEKCGDYCVDY